MSRKLNRITGGTKTTSECCFWTTGEDHLMRRRGSDNEFSGQVTEAKLASAMGASLRSKKAIWVELSTEVFSNNVPFTLGIRYENQKGRTYPLFLLAFNSAIFFSNLCNLKSLCSSTKSCTL